MNQLCSANTEKIIAVAGNAISTKPLAIENPYGKGNTANEIMEILFASHSINVQISR